MFGNEENGNGNGQEMETTIYMGKTSSVKGDLHIEGNGRIDGTVEGKVTVSGTLTLGPDGKVSTLIEGDHIIIGGRVDGRIVARKKVELLSSAVVNAEVVTPSFTIEEGAQFNGNCKMIGESGSRPKQKGKAESALSTA